MDEPHSISSGFSVKCNTEMEYCLFIKIRGVFEKLNTFKKLKYTYSHSLRVEIACTEELRKPLLFRFHPGTSGIQKGPSEDDQHFSGYQRIGGIYLRCDVPFGIHLSASHKQCGCS